MAKANAEATAERVDHLQGMILAGEPNTACLKYARQTWGVSRSQGYRLLKRAWRQVHDDIEGPDLDRQEMLAWCVQTLLETAGQAKARRNLTQKINECLSELGEESAAHPKDIAIAIGSTTEVVRRYCAEIHGMGQIERVAIKGQGRPHHRYYRP